MDIKEIIALDELFRDRRDISYEPLNGGFSNETYVVICDDIRYVVKIHFKQDEYLRLTRETELMAQSIAASMGIAPKVLSDPSQSRYSIHEFISGHLMEGDEIRSSENITKLADILKKIHSIKEVERRNSAFDLIDGYVRGIEQFQVKLPEGYRDILKRTEKIRYQRSLDKENNNVYCHNDILANNLLYDGKQIIAIDWELSGMGDPYMDLASLPYSCNFSQEQDKRLLEAYFGYYEGDMLIHLKNMRYIGLVREVVWSFFYAGLNKKSINHDFDYYGAGCYVLDRMQKGYLSLW